jgi:hypothetical protein
MLWALQRARYAGVEPELLQYQQRMQHEQTVRQQLSSEYEVCIPIIDSMSRLLLSDIVFFGRLVYCNCRRRIAR